MSKGETPKLADDGLCENTGCAIRGSEQCPIYRMMRDIAIPEVNNIINLPNKRGEMAGFQKATFDGYRPEDVIGIEEGRRWLDLQREVVQQESISIQQQIRNALQKQRPKKNEAKIIPFPKEKIA